MASGLIASLGASTSYSYTAPANCKLFINSCATGSSQSVTVNGTYIFVTVTGFPTQTFNQIPFYLAAGQQILIVTSAQAYATITSYEE